MIKFNKSDKEKKQKEDDKLQLGRRQFLKGSGAALGAAFLVACGAEPAASPTAVPTIVEKAATVQIVTNSYKDVVLRQIGTGVSSYNEVQEKVMEDLGFTVQMTALQTDENNQRAITQPDSWDVFDGEYFSLPLIVPSGNLLALDTSRIPAFDSISPIFTTGKLRPDSVIAQGTAPHKVMFVEGAGSTTFATEQTGYATLIPTIYNADTLGYRPDLTGRPIESWAELLNEEWQGKTAILDIPSIGIMDAAMVVESAGLMSFGDKGNMTKEELDQVTDILKEYKAAGQFRAFWKDFNESVNLMASGEVVVQSMWSPAVTAVKAQGIECVYAPLKEGYRAWGGGIGLNSNLEGVALDAAYEYINWWLTGWAGAFVGRQGYYSSSPENAKKYLTEAEWDFWYDGKEASVAMIDPFGTELEPAGALRDGGSYEDRMGSVVVWNSVMEEQDYLVQKWNEFIAS